MRGVIMTMCLLCALCCTLIGVVASGSLPEQNDDETPKMAVEAPSPTWLDESNATLSVWEAKWPAITDESLVRVSTGGRVANEALLADRDDETDGGEKTSDGTRVWHDDHDRLVRAEGTMRKPFYQMTTNVTAGIQRVNAFDDEVSFVMADYAYQFGWQLWAERVSQYVEETGNEVAWVVRLEYASNDDRAPAYARMSVASKRDHGRSLDLRLVVHNEDNMGVFDRAGLRLLPRGTMRAQETTETSDMGGDTGGQA